jgi:hypothetical protein
MLWSEITASWNEFRVANLFGTGTYIVPPFVFLALLGLAFVRVDRFTVSAFLGAGNSLVGALTYNFVDGRFYLPLLLLRWFPLAILPAEWAISRALKLRLSLSTVTVLAVLLLTCLGYPSQSGFKPESGRSQTWDALNYAQGNDKSLRYEAQKEFIRIFRDAPGLVLSDIDSPYLNALLPKPFVAAPIDGNHYYSFSRLWHYGQPEAAQLVVNGLARTIPVYALLLPSNDVDQDIKRLQQIVTWKRSATAPVQKL